MTFLFYLTSILFTLGQLGRISFINQQINFYFYEISLGISLLVLFFKYKFKPIKFAWIKYKAILIFPSLLFISFFIDIFNYSSFANLVSALYLVRIIFYFIFFLYLKFHSDKNINFFKIIKNSLKTVAILTIFSTLIQYFLYPDLRNLIYQGWDPHLYRTFGVFFDTSISAAIFGVLFFAIKQPLIKLAYLIIVTLSFSRSVYLGILLTITYILIQKKEFKKLALFILFFLIIVLIIPKPAGEGVNLKRIYSISSRAVDYQIGIDLWKNKPIFGYGYNRIRYIKNSESLHSGAGFNSSYLTILVSSGIIGLISFISMLWSLRRTNKIAPILILFLGIISLFDNILLHPFILFLFLTSLIPSR